MRDPFRVGVWGTGGLGGACLREILRRPDLELVGALTYSEAKQDVDAGTLVGAAAAGVPATTDRGAFLASRPECVLYVARDVGDFSADDDIIELLEAGINVVTPLPYRRIDLRGAEIAARVQRACEHGSASLLCAGLNPDFFSERLTATMTGLCNEVSRIHLREYFRMDGSVGDEMLGVVGFGAPVDDVKAGAVLATLARSYDVPSMITLAEQLGRPIDRVEVTNRSIPTPQAIEYRAVRVARGTIGMLGICFDGYAGDHRFVTFENFYYLTEAMRPEGARSDEYWTLEIEGRPSLRVTVEALTTVDGAARDEADPTTPGYAATTAAMLQAVPSVMAAPPGIKEPDWPPFHWRTDLRSTRAGVAR